MTNAAHLEARRLHQHIARLARIVRYYRKRGQLADADRREVLAFQSGDVVAVSRGTFRALQALTDDSPGRPIAGRWWPSRGA